MTNKMKIFKEEGIENVSGAITFGINAVYREYQKWKEWLITCNNTTTDDIMNVFGTEDTNSF